MCLIVLSWRPGRAQTLWLAANRDEFHDRPTAPLGGWYAADGDGPIWAGRDLEAGGTWLGVTAEGRFAAVTNFRELPADDPAATVAAPKSRGKLVSDYLAGGESPAGAARRIWGSRDHYRPFNLLLGDGGQLFYLGNRTDRIHSLPAGRYGLSNALLDTPWPKVRRVKTGLEAVLSGTDEPSPEHLLDLLDDRRPATDPELPDTGIGLQRERLLSAPFIQSPRYGTRSSSVLRLGGGHIDFWERRFAPTGERKGDTRVHLAWS